MAYQRRRTFSALLGVAFAALIAGTSGNAYASPGCDAMNIPWQPVDPLLKAWNAERIAGKYKIKHFSKGDRIVARVSTHHLMDNGSADPNGDPNGYGKLGLGAFQPGATTGNFIVQPSFGGFTYAVPADTADLFIFRFEDVGTNDDGSPAHFSVTCTNAGR